MKLNAKKIFLIVLCSLCLALLSWGLIYQPSVVADYNELLDVSTAETASSNVYYGYNLIKDNAKYLAVYNIICDGIGAQQTTIDISKYKLKLNELRMIYEFYRFDHVEHYWIPNQYDYKYNMYNGEILSMSFEYLIGFTDSLFTDVADEYLNLVAGLTSEYEIALVLHDALVNNVTYVKDAPNAHNAYGALVGGKAVCEGYAEAYQYLLQRCNIMSYIVTGASKGVDPEGHEWNLVRLDGKFYYTDVTWDDPNGNTSGYVYHAYFNLPTAILEEDHTIDDTYHVLPDCVDFDKLYHKMVVVDQYDVDTLAVHVQPVGNVADLYIYFIGELEDDNFNEWMDNSVFSQLVSATIFDQHRPVNGNLYQHGREHILKITGPLRPATKVTLNKNTLEMFTGCEGLLTAVVTPSDYCSDLAVWSSNNPDVLKVDNGKLIALQAGSAIVTVKAGLQTAVCTVTIIDCTHVTKTKHAAVASTCSTKGNEEYFVCDGCGHLFNGRGEEIEAMPELPLVAHQFNTDLAWEWADDYRHASLTAYCDWCAKVVTISAEITSEITLAPTESTSGEIVYTATVKNGDKTYTDTKTATLPQLPAAPTFAEFWNALIGVFSLGGHINGYVGLGITVGVLGGILVAFMVPRRKK